MMDYIKTIKDDIKKVDSEIGELLKKTTDLQDKRNKLNIQLNDEIYKKVKLNVWYKVTSDEDIESYFLPLRKNDGDVIGTLLRIQGTVEGDRWLTIYYGFYYYGLQEFFKETVPNNIIDDLLNKYIKKKIYETPNDSYKDI